jgi:acyl-CoA reductase-like NAD-dependent aldehyde dehydrogenase
MSRLEIEWPDAGAERVRAARGRLLQARDRLRDQSFEDRLSVITQILGDWTAPDSPWRRELSASLAAETDFSAGTVSEGLDSALRAWDPQRFAQCARQELISPRRTLASYEWTTVVAGGTIPMPTLLSVLISLTTGSPVLLKETSKDPVTASLLARSISARDESLGRCFEHLSVPSTDTEALREVLSAPCIVATGSDETIRSISSSLSPTQHLVAYGHRFSIALIGPQIANDSTLLNQAAQGLARDVARWDQSGCLSPALAYIVDCPESVAREFVTATAEALETLSTNMPRGAVDASSRAAIGTERAEARMRAASGSAMLIEGANHTVILEDDALPRPAPLHRFLRVMPVDSLNALNRALTPFSGHLSNIAMSGFERQPRDHQGSSDMIRLMNRLSELGVSRVTIPGCMQTPPIDWPHDGLPLFTPVARFVQSDFVID